MEEEELEKAVHAYLRKKGFKLSDLALQDQNRLSASSHNDLVLTRFGFARRPSVFFVRIPDKVTQVDRGLVGDAH